MMSFSLKIASQILLAHFSNDMKALKRKLLLLCIFVWFLGFSGTYLGCRNIFTTKISNKTNMLQSNKKIVRKFKVCNRSIILHFRNILIFAWFEGSSVEVECNMI